MRVLTARRAGAAVTVVAVCAGAVGVLAGGASASGADKQDDGATITMEAKGKDLFFSGPTKIAAGSDLTIENNTDPSKIGPHTFTIVDKSLIPKSKQEIKDCFKLKDPNCVRIFKAHKVDFKKETVGKIDVENGKKGWDAPFTEDEDGDSWFALNEGDSTDRKLAAKPGDTLYYFCAIHPFMSGKIKVTK